MIHQHIRIKIMITAIMQLDMMRTQLVTINQRLTVHMIKLNMTKMRMLDTAQLVMKAIIKVKFYLE